MQTYCKNTHYSRKYQYDAVKIRYYENELSRSQFTIFQPFNVKRLAELDASLQGQNSSSYENAPLSINIFRV